MLPLAGRGISKMGIRRGKLNHEAVSKMKVHEVGATKLSRPSRSVTRSAELWQHVDVIRKAANDARHPGRTREIMG